MLQNRNDGSETSRKIRISKEPDARRQEIVETALRLFSKKGYEETTIQDIAETMRVSQGLCYRYFRSKAEIFDAAAAYYTSQAIEQIKVPMPDDMPAIDKFNLILEKMTAFAIKNHEFESRYSEGTETRAVMLDSAAEQLSSVMLPIIEQGVREGAFQCEQIQHTVNFLNYGMIHAFHAGMPSDNQQDYMNFFEGFLRETAALLLKF